MPSRDAARQAEREAMTENSSVLQQDTEAALKKILKPAQFTRVQQIDLQEAGNLVIARPDVAKALNLAPDQVDQVNTVINQLKQGQDQVDTSRRDFFNTMRNNGGGGGRGGNNNNGGGGGGGGRGGNNNNGGNNTNTPPLTDAEQQARREQFQQVMDKSQTDSQSLKEKRSVRSPRS